MRHQRGWECLAADRARLDMILRHSKRLGYCSSDLPSIAELFNSADDDFFHRININPNHVLQPYLPDKINLPYHPRNRTHNMTLINKTKFLNDSDFIVCMLYKSSYWFTQTSYTTVSYIASCNHSIHYSRQFYIYRTLNLIISIHVEFNENFASLTVLGVPYRIFTADHENQQLNAYYVRFSWNLLYLWARIIF